MFGPRTRHVRDYLNDASIKALKCANDARTGDDGSPSAAAHARVMSAVLGDLRDAFDLRAPWLRDYPQVLAYAGEAENASRRCAYRLDITAEALAMCITEALDAADEEGQDGPEDAQGGEPSAG